MVWSGVQSSERDGGVNKVETGGEDGGTAPSDVPFAHDATDASEADKETYTVASSSSENDDTTPSYPPFAHDYTREGTPALQHTVSKKKSTKLTLRLIESLLDREAFKKTSAAREYAHECTGLFRVRLRFRPCLVPHLTLAAKFKINIDFVSRKMKTASSNRPLKTRLISWRISSSMETRMRRRMSRKWMRCGGR